MGLDNGIRVKGIPEEDKKKIPYYNESWGDFLKEGEIEPIYWRKCWGLRREVISVLHMSKDEFKKEIDPEDIPALIRALMPFLSRDYWDRDADSIWEYDEYFQTIYKNLVFLEWLKYYYKEHPDIEVYFYDSY